MQCCSQTQLINRAGRHEARGFRVRRALWWGVGLARRDKWAGDDRACHGPGARQLGSRSLDARFRVSRLIDARALAATAGSARGRKPLRDCFSGAVSPPARTPHAQIAANRKDGQGPSYVPAQCRCGRARLRSGKRRAARASATRARGTARQRTQNRRCLPVQRRSKNHCILRVRQSSMRRHAKRVHGRKRTA
jgi:hypothetical protein